MNRFRDQKTVAVPEDTARFLEEMMSARAQKVYNGSLKLEPGGLAELERHLTNVKLGLKEAKWS